MVNDSEDKLLHFNEEKLLQSIGGDKEFVLVLVKTFFDNYQKYVQSIEAAIMSNNQDLLKLNAHSIKGSASSVYFEKLASIARELEMADVEDDKLLDKPIDGIRRRI